MSKDLIIRSSAALFIIFERQTHEKGIQVRFEVNYREILGSSKRGK